MKGSEENMIVDKIGYFQFVDLKPGNYQIVVFKNNYETKTIDFSVQEGEKRKDLGVIVLNSVLYNSTEQGFTLLDSDSDNDDDNSSLQTTVGLLQSSQDIFNRIAGYDLGIYWFRPRGLDSRSGEMMFNGVSMSKQNNGNIDFSSWEEAPKIPLSHGLTGLAAIKSGAN